MFVTVVMDHVGYGVDRPDFLPNNWYVIDAFDTTEKFVGYACKDMAVVPHKDGWALCNADRYTPKGASIQRFGKDKLAAAVMAGVLLSNDN